MNSSVAVELKCDKDIYVYGDEKWLVFMITQVLLNAIKYKKEKDAKIIMSVKRENGKILLKILDNGKGIKKEDQHKLLKDSTHFTTYGTNSEEGSGLGLLLCRDFARKNGGELWFESEENLGSVFSFSLPQLIA